MKNFFERHSPKCLDEVVGNSKAIEEIKDWSKEHKRPLFIYGPIGVGKTLCANLLAKDNNWAMLYTDASDLRDKETIKNLLGVASTSCTLFSNTRLIVIDEVDLATDKRGGEDYGFFSELEKVIENSIQPIVLIANDPYENKKVLQLFEKCKQVRFERPHKQSLLKFAREICEKEGIEYDIVSLNKIVDKSANDIRAMMIDIYSLSFNKKITVEDAEWLGERKLNDDVFKGLQKVFYPKDFYETRAVVDNLSIDWELLMAWVEENVPRQYKNKENLKNAFECLSMADVYKSRIRGSNWVLLKYVLDYLTVGVAYSRKEREVSSGYVPFQFPRVLKMYGTKEKTLQKNVVEKIRQKIHCSKRIILRDYLPFFSIIAKTNKSTADLVRYFEFTFEEIKYLGANLTEKQFAKFVE